MYATPLCAEAMRHSRGKDLCSFVSTQRQPDGSWKHTAFRESLGTPGTNGYSAYYVKLNWLDEQVFDAELVPPEGTFVVTAIGTKKAWKSFTVQYGQK